MQTEETEVGQLKEGIRQVLKALSFYDSADDVYYQKEAAAMRLAEAIVGPQSDIGEDVYKVAPKEYDQWWDARKLIEVAALQLADAVWNSKPSIGDVVDKACPKEYLEWRQLRQRLETIDTTRAALSELAGGIAGRSDEDR